MCLWDYQLHKTSIQATFILDQKIIITINIIIIIFIHQILNEFFFIFAFSSII